MSLSLDARNTAQQLGDVLAPLKTWYWRLIMGKLLLAAALTGWISYTYRHSGGLTTFFTVIGAWLVWAIGGGLLRKGYPAAYKAAVAAAVASRVAPGLRFKPQGDLTRDAEHRSRFMTGRFLGFRTMAVHQLQEGFSGQVGDRTWEIAELGSGSGLRLEATLMFVGLLGQTELSPPIDGCVMLWPDVAERFLGKAGATLQAVNQVVAAEHADMIATRRTLPDNLAPLVTIDDPAFEKVFRVHASSTDLAHRLLTPHVRERLVELAAAAPGTLYLTFDHDRLYLGLSDRHGYVSALPKGRAGRAKPIARLFDALATFLAIPSVLAHSSHAAVGE